jgi:biotin operon repressor/catechol 2,3-dioxygenase-like lactoylglutathione lyase family enzyme
MLWVRVFVEAFVSRAIRLLELMELLRRHRHPVTGAALAEELGITLRSLYRDIATMRGQGAPIRGEPGVGYLLRPGFTLPPLNFTEEEAEALALGGQWVERHTDTGLAKAARSAAFYSDLLGSQPVLASPSFILFDLDHGFHLGLWARDKVDLAGGAGPGESSELCLIAPDLAALRALHGEWAAKGIRIAMEPRKMYFGAHNFVGLDPDGHRLRVSTPD